MHDLKRGIFPVGLSLTLLLALPLPLQAFRCGNGLVSVGDSKGKVLIECGKPTFKEKVADRETRRRTGTKKTGAKTTKSVEQWTYNCGKDDFIYILTFEGGKLVREETDGRGRGESECKGR
ncbi:MAG TPA: DUF2845 domain-containing protein [Syntrophales bacterium]|nr:DUF2845 domain-containing protein [Syntrophales bacterium]